MIKYFSLKSKKLLSNEKNQHFTLKTFVQLLMNNFIFNNTLLDIRSITKSKNCTSFEKKSLKEEFFHKVTFTK